jgi:hypothetical protein
MNPKDLERIAGKVASGKSGTVRTAGKIEFIRDQGPVRRDIRAPGFEWSPESFNDLAKILWAAQRAHSYSMAALRIFSKMPSSKFSPDGLLGGRGYIQSIKDMRGHLGQASEILSSFTDTVHDEINADHWNPAESKGDASGIIHDTETTKQNPEGFVDNELKQVQGPGAEMGEELGNPDPDDYNPGFDPDAPPGAVDEEDVEDDDPGQSQTAAAEGSFWLKGESYLFGNDGALQDRPDYGTKSKRPGSKLPQDETDQKQGKTEAEMTMNTTTMDRGSYASAFNRMLRSQEGRTASSRTADSSLPVDTLPGPRVDHIGPGEGNEAGHFNHENVWPSDHPNGEGMSSGTNESEHLYEDWVTDGNTGNDNPTDGDSSVLNVSSVKPKVAHSGYSWLPGSRNEKNMPYYDRDLTQEDIDWMVANSDPDPVDKVVKEKKTFNNLWEADLI